jgi:hypothetical protein
MANADKTGQQENAQLGRELVAQLDAVSHAGTTADAPAGIELRVGFLLWPTFPLLSLAGFCDALRHAADVGDQSRPLRCTWTLLGKLRCRRTGARAAWFTRAIRLSGGDRRPAAPVG